MPLYEFVCDACHARVEKIQKHSDPAPAPCPSCGGGPMVRQMSSPAIQFKGSGWYITDYAKKGSAPSDAGSKTEKTDTAEKGDKAEKTDTKTDTAAAAKSEPSPAPAASKPSSES
jgi:putative FmdB family regulatory protein